MQCERVFIRDYRAVKPAAWAFAIAFPFFLIELVGGLRIGSLALVADAMHLAMDLVALAMTLIVAFASQRPPDEKRTFGYERLEVLAALANGILLWVAVGIILREAYQRFSFPVAISAKPMALIASLGLLCNLSSGWILYSSSRKNINLRSIFRASVFIPAAPPFIIINISAITGRIFLRISSSARLDFLILNRFMS